MCDACHEKALIVIWVNSLIFTNLFISFAQQNLDDDFAEFEDNNEELHSCSSKKRRPGRRADWKQSVVDDFIDILVSDEGYRSKLIYQNTKNQHNGLIFESILSSLKKRCEARDTDVPFDVKQLRSKFKKLVAECKSVSMTIKTKSGIKRFQEEKGYGKWFELLFPLVRARESCQPDMAIEPSAKRQPDHDHSDPHVPEEGHRQFVPVKRTCRRKSAKDAISDVAELLQKNINNDPTKDLMNLIREENQKSREHEVRLFQMMYQNHQNLGFHHHSSAPSTAPNPYIDKHSTPPPQARQAASSFPSISTLDFYQFPSNNFAED